MRPVLLTLRGRPVYSYPACLYVGLVAGTYVGAFEASRTGVSADRFTIAVLVLVPLALIGARVWFLALHRREYRGHGWRLVHRGGTGLAMYGGLAVAVPASVVLLPRLGVQVGRFWDAATFTILTGMIPTRFGCLLNGCCAGRETSKWPGLLLADRGGRSVRRVPIQLLEAASGALLLGMAFALGGAGLAAGSLFLCVAAAYASIRYALDGWRDAERSRSAWRLTRAASLLLLTCALAALIAVLVGWP